jgi:hypothetical protein
VLPAIPGRGAPQPIHRIIVVRAGLSLLQAGHVQVGSAIEILLRWVRLQGGARWGTVR